MSDAQLAELENEANAAIRDARAMRTHYFSNEAEYEAGLEATGLQVRHKVSEAAPASASAAPVPIRVMEIAGVDFNKCGGTHVESLSELQLIKVRLSSRTRARIEKIERFFVAFPACLHCQVAIQYAHLLSRWRSSAELV